MRQLLLIVLALFSVSLMTACGAVKSVSAKNTGADGGHSSKPAPIPAQLLGQSWCVNGTGSGGIQIQERYTFLDTRNFDYYQFRLINGQRTGDILYQARGSYTLNGDFLNMTATTGENAQYFVGYTPNDAKTRQRRLYFKDPNSANEYALDPCP